MVLDIVTRIKPSTLSNLIGYNIAWFGLILIGDNFIPVAIALFVSQLWFFKAAKNEILLILLVALVGIGLDLTLVYFGVFIFPDTEWIPLWLLTLWFVFAGTIRHSLAFLENAKLLQLFVGAIFAPLSYIAGAKLSVVYFVPSLGVTYFLLASVWAPLMLVIFSLSRWLLTLEEKSNVG